MAAQQLVILGGTGFVGSHLVPRLADDGHRIVLLSRNREQHRELGVLPQVTIRSADVYNDDVLRREFEGADAVINLIGILNTQGRHTFQRAHVELTRRVIAACHASSVNRLHQMSSLKAGQGLSQYLKTRGEAETLVKASGLDWTNSSVWPVYSSQLWFTKAGVPSGLTVQAATGTFCSRAAWRCSASLAWASSEVRCATLRSSSLATRFCSLRSRAPCSAMPASFAATLKRSNSVCMGKSARAVPATITPISECSPIREGTIEMSLSPKEVRSSGGHFRGSGPHHCLIAWQSCSGRGIRSCDGATRAISTGAPLAGLFTRT